jgi:hypothetical protein
MQKATMPTVAELIEKYINLRDTIARLTDAHEAKLKPYTNGLQLIEGLLTEEINRLDGQAIKTQHGTAYRSTVTQFRVADRELWLDYIFKNDRRDFLTTNVSKEAVKEHMDTSKEQLPGLTMTTIWKTLVRRPD